MPYRLLRPTVCDSTFCIHRQQETAGKNGLLEAAVLTDPYVLDLLITLSYAAISENSLFPFPAHIEGLEVCNVDEHGSFTVIHDVICYENLINIDVQVGDMFSVTCAMRVK